jgi:hypothetical protein
MTVHSDARSWDDLWEVVKAGPSGGQATSRIARRRDGSVELGFVKILTRQDDTERRARFYREAAISAKTQNFIHEIPRSAKAGPGGCQCSPRVMRRRCVARASGLSS